MKKIFLSLALILLTIGVVNAIIYFPLPVVVKVDGPVVSGLEARVTNLRTDKFVEGFTNGAGELVIEWANSDDSGETIIKYQSGDVFKVELTSCSSNFDDCVKELTYSGQPELVAFFDLRNMPCPVCETCPDPIVGGSLGVIIGIIAGFVLAMGGGIKIYKNRVGKTVVLHRHKGIRNYHDPNVRHMNPSYRHRLLRDDAVGFFDDVKKINEGGL